MISEQAIAEYFESIPANTTQDELDTLNREYNLQHGLGCKRCGCADIGLVIDKARYYDKCHWCGNMVERKVGYPSP